MNWRPKDWQKVKDDWYKHSAHGQILDGIVYEVGADAMLEAIDKASKDGKVDTTLYGLSFYEEEE